MLMYYFELLKSPIRKPRLIRENKSDVCEPRGLSKLRGRQLWNHEGLYGKEEFVFNRRLRGNPLK